MGNRISNKPAMLRDPISNRNNNIKRSFQSKGIMEALQDTGSFNTTMGQDIAKGAEGSKISNIIENIFPKLFKVSSLTDSKPLPNRGTVAVDRERANTRAKTNIVGKLPRKGITRQT